MFRFVLCMMIRTRPVRNTSGFTPYHFSKKSGKGFTLIEAIIYLALVSFLMVSVLAAVYPIFTGTERTSQKITVDGEVAFVLRKIAWALGPVSSVSAPAEGLSGDTLTIDTLTFTESSGGILLD